MLCYCKRCLSLDKFLVCVNEEYSTKKSGLVWLWKKQLYWSWPGQFKHQHFMYKFFFNCFGFFMQHMSASIYRLISLQTNFQDMFVWICLGPISRCIEKLFLTFGFGCMLAASIIRLPAQYFWLAAFTCG